eukprot:1477734-Rhodomonas_salina.2
MEEEAESECVGLRERGSDDVVAEEETRCAGVRVHRMRGPWPASALLRQEEVPAPLAPTHSLRTFRYLLRTSYTISAASYATKNVRRLGPVVVLLVSGTGSGVRSGKEIADQINALTAADLSK